MLPPVIETHFVDLPYFSLVTIATKIFRLLKSLWCGAYFSAVTSTSLLCLGGPEGFLLVQLTELSWILHWRNCDYPQQHSHPIVNVLRLYICLPLGSFAGKGDYSVRLCRNSKWVIDIFFSLYLLLLLYFPSFWFLFSFLKLNWGTHRLQQLAGGRELQIIPFSFPDSERAHGMVIV